MKKLIVIGIICLFFSLGFSTVSADEEKEITKLDVPNKLYLRAQEINIAGEGWGIKSFPINGPMIIFYMIFVKLTTSSPDLSYIKPLVGERVYFENATILIIGSRIGLIGTNRFINTNWYGFLHKSGFIGGNIHVYAEAPAVVIFLE
jgi:hypothetical protein